MAVNYNPKIVTDGLVLYLDAANAKCLQVDGAVLDMSQQSGLSTFNNSPSDLFTNSSVWIPTSTAPTLSNRSISTTAGGIGISAPSALTIGMNYLATVLLTECVGSFQLRNGLNSGGAPLILSASSPGTYSNVFTASSTAFYLRANTQLDVTFEDILIREYTGNVGQLTEGVSSDLDGLGSFTFNGVDGSLNITIPNTTGEYSSIYWVNTARNTNWRALNATNFRYSAPWHISSTRLEFDNRNISGNLIGIDLLTPILNNVWTQVAVTRTSDFLTTVYINDIENGSTTEWTEEFRLNNIGFKTSDTGFMPFQGKIGPSAVYNRALLPAEIRQNFNAIRGRFGV
jgi:hypothetical protein